MTFNLLSGTHRPLRKPNDNAQYIHSSSNHPPNIKKQLPAMISKRLPQNSCNKEEFNKAIPEYEEALPKSCYNAKLEYEETTKSKKKNRKINIIWFNSPFDATVKTNVEREFFKLMNTHFPRNHPLHKICNQNNVKLSYYYTSNMASIISGQNKNLLQNNPAYQAQLNRCNCRQNTTNSCPLNGECCSSSLVYKASITTKENAIPEKHYYGLCETAFKTRYNNHTHTFRDKEQNCTELSKLYWNLTSAGKKPQISWTIEKHANACLQKRKSKCQLCLAKKVSILQANPSTTINRRSELVSKCRHKSKFKLKNFKPD